jgi:type I restriction enzyme S subunit
MSEWIETELKNLTSKIGSGATPRGGQEAYKSEGISLIRSQNILDFTFSKNGLAYIDETQAHELRNVEIQEKDVLINITGDSVARVCMVPKEILPARVNQHVAILRTDSKKLDPDYLLYYLLNPVIKRHLLRLSSDGATRNALTKSNLEELIISAPKNLDEQKEIASKLRLIDSKITLLRQQNETLEELAQTLFKRWFVDFEFPNENGDPYKSSGGKMVDSDPDSYREGKIPEGWSIKSIEEFTDVMASGGTPSTKNESFYQGTFNWFSTKELKDNFLIQSERQISKEAINNSSAKIFPKHAVLMAIYAAPTVGRLGIITRESTFNQAALGFVAKQEIGYPFIFLMLKNLRKDFNSLANGAAQQNLNVGLVKNFKTIYPLKKTILQFKEMIGNMFDQIENNSFEIQSLTQLRDTLLPKLMSGEIEIKK